MPFQWTLFGKIFGSLFVIILIGGIIVFGNDDNDNPAASDSGTDEINQALYDESYVLADRYREARAIIETEKGNIVLELFLDDAPKTVTNFVTHAENGYYDGLGFHRVIDGFMIQGGDPSGDGTGGESIWERSFEDEINPASLGLDTLKVSDADFLAGGYDPDVLANYADRSVMELYTEQNGYRYREDVTSRKMEPGVIAMANRGPMTNGSQFFIVTESEQPHLDGKHTVFGRVVEGMDVVNSIEMGDLMQQIRIDVPAAEDSGESGETLDSFSIPVQVE